jgi:hypothetical protein
VFFAGNQSKEFLSDALRRINLRFVEKCRSKLDYYIASICNPLQNYLRYEVFTAVTMKNAVFWDIKPQFVPHRKHITSLLQSPAGYYYVRCMVFTVVTAKNATF